MQSAYSHPNASSQQMSFKLSPTYLIVLQAQHPQPAASAAALMQQPCQRTRTDVLDSIV
jgi:hypothetical protein